MDTLKIHTQTVTLVDQVEDKFLNYIKEKNLHAGDSIPNELELASALGVARSVLREALSRLKMMGMIETRTRRGMILTEPTILGGMKRVIDPRILSDDSIFDILGFRIALEIGICSDIFRNITPEDITELEEIVKIGTVVGNNEYAPVSEYTFHAKLYEITGNKTISEFQGIIHPIMDFVKSKFKGLLEPINIEMKKKGEIVTGIIQKADGSAVILDLGKLEGIMPLKEQIPTEEYKVNDKIRGYVLDVEKGAKGNPQVIVSRSHPDFVRKLFEFEIPEIYEGLIEIKSISRDVGSRSKVAVYSTNPNIDPVGSCVGQKGVRIQNIINELNGEKIDVIEWNEDPAVYIAAALLPAQVLAVDVKEDEKFAQVIVQDDQLSLAIGKSGQNARLAARLTNWKIDIKSESQFREMLAKANSEEVKEDEDSQEENTEE